MTIHYHGTPISPVTELYSLSGRSFCVAWARPDDLERLLKIAQMLMFDCSAYTVHTMGLILPSWHGYYEWIRRYCTAPTSWAVIPDVIAEGSQAQDALLREWPADLRDRGAPVWHSSEPVDRMLRLLDAHPRVCIGSTDEHWQVMGAPWMSMMDTLWDAIASQFHTTRLPWVHMLRGMQCAGQRWPFASLDSSDVGQNHHRPVTRSKKRAAAALEAGQGIIFGDEDIPLMRPGQALAMANRWDALQCPAAWVPPAQPEQLMLDELVSGG